MLYPESYTSICKMQREQRKKYGGCIYMARTKIIPPAGLLSDLEYTSVIVNYSNGIDSTGTLYWALKNFPKEKIILIYCDTGCEYPERTVPGSRYETPLVYWLPKNNGNRQMDTPS